MPGGQQRGERVTTLATLFEWLPLRQCQPFILFSLSFLFFKVMNTLTLGDAALDGEHALLHQCVTTLLQADGDRAVAALDVLRACAAKHFESEDDDLRLIGDGNARCHMDEHRTVLASLDEVRSVLVGDEFDATAKGRLVSRLAAQFFDWLPHHVQQMDSGVAAYRFKTRTGGAAVCFFPRTETVSSAR